MRDHAGLHRLGTDPDMGATQEVARTRPEDAAVADSPLTLAVDNDRDIFDPAREDHFIRRDGKVYASQYNSGLRILDGTDILSGDAPELAYFDTAPYSDGVSFNGAWSNYPFFESGSVVLSNIETGLFILKPTI